MCEDPPRTCAGHDFFGTGRIPTRHQTTQAHAIYHRSNANGLSGERPGCRRLLRRRGRGVPLASPPSAVSPAERVDELARLRAGGSHRVDAPAASAFPVAALRLRDPGQVRAGEPVGDGERPHRAVDARGGGGAGRPARRRRRRRRRGVVGEHDDRARAARRRGGPPPRGGAARRLRRGEAGRDQELPGRDDPRRPRRVDRVADALRQRRAEARRGASTKTSM